MRHIHDKGRTNKIIGTKFSDWIENFDEESGIATYVLSSDISIHIELEETVPYENEDWVRLFPDKSAYEVEFRIKKDNRLIDEKIFVYTDGRRYLCPQPQIKNEITFFNPVDKKLAAIFSPRDLSDWESKILYSYKEQINSYRNKRY